MLVQCSSTFLYAVQCSQVVGLWMMRSFMGRYISDVVVRSHMLSSVVVRSYTVACAVYVGGSTVVITHTMD